MITMNSSRYSLELRREQDFVDIVVGSGPWQRRILLVMLFVFIPGAMHCFAMTFLAPEIDHWCAKPSYMENVTQQEWRSKWLPPGDMKNCYRYEIGTLEPTLYENTSSGIIHNILPCDTWEYDHSFYTSTIRDKWNLVCDREWLVSLSTSIFMAGTQLGIFVFGCVSDKLGRRPTITISSSVMVSFAFLCSFSVSFTMFLITRFMVAVGIGGVFTTFFVLLMEVSSPKMRFVYGMVVQFGWCFGYVILPGVAWLVRDWFWLQIAITLPCIGRFGIWWIVPESPRWLLTQGRIEEARKILRAAAKSNKVDLFNFSALSNLLEEATKVHNAGETEGNVLDLLITPGLWKTTLNVYFLWLVCGFVYYGLSLNTNELKSDPFITFALSGAVEFPAYILSIFAMQHLGRRIPIAVAMITAGSACMLAYPLPEGRATVVVSMIGKFCITSSLGMAHVFTTELFPTVIRNAAIGSAALCEGIGSTVAPFSKELGEATHPVIPLVVIGILSLISGFLVLLLPETHNCVVPDTLKEAVNGFKRRTVKKTPFEKHKRIPKKSEIYTCFSVQESHHRIDCTTPLLGAPDKAMMSA